MTNSPNPFVSIIVFVILTIIYFISKYFLQKNNKINYLTISLVIYLCSLIISELIINIKLTKAICGSNQWGTAFIVTALPWIVIFGLLNVLLTIFPSWLIPFSNTFGYGITKLAGISGVFNNILEPRDGVTGPLAETLEKIYDDKSLLINQIGNTDQAFDKFWNSLNKAKLLQPNASNFRGQLRDLIYLKNIVAEFIWSLLAGILTASASYNFIITSACSHSVADMQQKHEEYEKHINIEQTAEDTAPEKRVYSRHE
jgi:hypothetical protein